MRMRCTGFSRYVSRGNEWLRLLCLSWKKRTRLWFFMHSLRTDTELQTHPRVDIRNPSKRTDYHWAGYEVPTPVGCNYR